MHVLAVDANSFVDTAFAIDKTTHFATSAFARIVVSTTATSVDVSTYRTISGGYTYLREIGVIVNGVFNQAIRPADGAATNTITLPAGSKTVSFVNGVASGDTSNNADTVADDQNGCWLTSLDFNAAFTLLTPNNARKIYILGDSISVGDGAEVSPTGLPQEKAWPIQVRLQYPGQVLIDAWGGRQFYADMSNSTKRGVAVARMTAAAPSVIWLFNTNDYTFALWSASTFGTAFATFLDDVHTALPNAKVIAMTSLTRGDEGTPNAQGNTPDDYRDAVETAASTRTSYVTVLDGPSVLTYPTYFKDSPHPNGTGHAMIASAAISMIALLEGRVTFRLNAS